MCFYLDGTDRGQKNSEIIETITGAAASTAAIAATAPIDVGMYVTRDNALAVRGRIDFTEDDYVLVPSPVIVPTIQDVAAISNQEYAGQFVIKTDGTVWKIEMNRNAPAPHLEFQKVEGIENCIKVSVGTHHILALCEDGRVWSWGKNESGQLGRGYQSESEPVNRIEYLSNVIDIAAGGNHSLALCADGAVFSWGGNEVGQLGTGFWTNEDFWREAYDDRTEAEWDMIYAEFGSREAYAAFLTDFLGVRGVFDRSTPGLVKLSDSAIQVLADRSASRVLLADGSLWEWGNLKGGYWYGADAYALSPEKNATLENICAIASSGGVYAALDTSGRVWQWGYLEPGGGKKKPELVSGLPPIVAVAGGRGTRVAIAADGTLWLWGYDLAVRDKEGYPLKVAKPVQISKKAGMSGQVIHLQCGYEYSPSEWATEEVSVSIASSLVPEDLQTYYQFSITCEEFCRLAVTLLEEKSGMTRDVYLEANGYALGQNPYKDTKNPDVLFASAIGVVKGKGNQTFVPDGYITRQEAATMLYRLALVLDYELPEATHVFADNNAVADWAKDAVGAIGLLTDAKNGKAVMEGVGENRFDPDGTYTREQAFITMNRLFMAGEE